MNVSCKKAAHLLSEQHDRSLSVAERSALQAHLLLCRGCRSLEQHLDTLRRGLKRLFEESQR